MKHLHFPALALVVLLTCGFTATQDMQEISHLWQQTLDALRTGDQPRARDSFGEFNQKVRAYVTTNGRSWQIEYLAGSLDCQFPESRASGAKVLQDILQNNRALNQAGEKEVRRQLTACTAPAAAATPVAGRTEFPLDIADNSTHFQAPGVHGDMKSGSLSSGTMEGRTPISPLAESVLRGRLVNVSQPQKALSEALKRLPGSTGSVVSDFAVVTMQPGESSATGIGNCLKNYLLPLKNEFGIKPSNYMVTVYAAQYTNAVYDYARKLHGLELPYGVIAYSVPEDMSLTAQASPASCGSMAHELVHLLIKQSFPVSPAWLEEGLASEVAIASPTQGRFRFGYSWRDDILRDHWEQRPQVAALLDTSWADFSATSYNEMGRAAAVQAMAAVFIRYLDEKGKLSDVYYAVRDQHLSPDLSAYRSYQDIVAEKLGMHVNDLDPDFAQWFKNQQAARERASATEARTKPAASENRTSPCGVPTSANAPPCMNEPANQMNAPMQNRK